MYVTKHVNPRIVAAALRSIMNQTCGSDLAAVREAVGQLALQLMQDGSPIDAREGTMAAEFVHMITDNLESWEYRVEVLGH